MKWKYEEDGGKIPSFIDVDMGWVEMTRWEYIRWLGRWLVLTRTPEEDGPLWIFIGGCFWSIVLGVVGILVYTGGCTVGLW